jgi:NAD(P)-dependent dehydrogenase (short-subunit alcohol dehydrogenase family)
MSGDPKQQGPQPPLPEQSQPYPGAEAQMEPQPDYGEQSYQGSGKLEGKAALITGADSGIGRAVALAFAREGADVLISYLNEHQDAQETARVVAAAGRKAVTMAGDIGDPEHCRQLVRRALQELGRLDILVNNAAFQQTHQSFTEIPPEELERTYRTNIFAMFYLCQAAVPHMPPGSAIINTCSIQAYQPSPSLLAYASTKGAIVTFTKGLAQEVAQKGIRVNVVAPGPVWTPLIPATMSPEQVKSFGQDSLLGRPAQPAELAPAFVFLAAPESSYVTGERLGVTGSASLP